VDLEWAFDGQKVFWLQVRPITTLTNVPLYSNHISREVLPGIIKPLIASVNIPLVNTAWIRLFDSLLGATQLKPEDLTRLFHYRAYFNMAAIGTIFEILGFPRESLELLLGFERTAGRPAFRPSMRTLRHVPRLLRFTASAWNYDKRVKAELEAYEQRAK
jgi:pyruvate,water dikinase